MGISIPAISTLPKGAKAKGKGKEDEDARLVVELVKSRPGVEPKLNRPVVLDAEGKIPEKEPEKTFLQK